MFCKNQDTESHVVSFLDINSIFALRTTCKNMRETIQLPGITHWSLGFCLSLISHVCRNQNGDLMEVLMSYLLTKEVCHDEKDPIWPKDIAKKLLCNHCFPLLEWAIRSGCQISNLAELQNDNYCHTETIAWFQHISMSVFPERSPCFWISPDSVYMENNYFSMEGNEFFSDAELFFNGVMLLKDFTFDDELVRRHHIEQHMKKSVFEYPWKEEWQNDIRPPPAFICSVVQMPPKSDEEQCHQE